MHFSSSSDLVRFQFQFIHQIFHLTELFCFHIALNVFTVDVIAKTQLVNSLFSRNTTFLVSAKLLYKGPLRVNFVRQRPLFAQFYSENIFQPAHFCFHYLLTVFFVDVLANLSLGTSYIPQNKRFNGLHVALTCISSSSDLVRFPFQFTYEIFHLTGIFCFHFALNVFTVDVIGETQLVNSLFSRNTAFGLCKVTI